VEGGIKLKYEQIKELLKLVEESSLVDFELAENDFSLKMKKSAGVVQYIKPEAEENYVKLEIGESEKIEKNDQTENTKAEAVTENAEVPQDEAKVYVVKSPLVGTFYSCPQPGKPAFVKAGDKVSKGQVLCIVEAMKVMNEILSEEAGEVIQVLAKEEAMVEYGTPLLWIKKL